MLRSLVRLLVLISTYNCINGASVSVNLKLTQVCTNEIIVHTSSAVANFKQTSGVALVQRSGWVSRILTQMNVNLYHFVAQARILNAAYQTGTTYSASTTMRDAISRIIDILSYARSVAWGTRVSDASTLSSEINSVIAILTTSRSELQQYTVFNLLTSFQLMSSVLQDSQVTRLSKAVLRSSQVLQKVMVSVTTRIRKDNSFTLLAAAQDFKIAIEAGRNAAANSALTVQSSYFETCTDTSTATAYGLLNTNKAIFDAYTTSIILEFNGFGAYAQFAINVLTNAVIRLLVSSSTVDTVYVPLGQQLLTGLAEAYIAVNFEFLTAIQDCNNVIESKKPGANGSNSSNRSGASDGSNNPETPYSMKGEVKKCQKRGRGLILDMQEQFKKSDRAPVCGAYSINTVIWQVGVAQTSVNQCASQLVVQFRKVLEQVKVVIREEIDKNLRAMKSCAVKAKKVKDNGGSSGEKSASCTKNNVDPQFTRVKTRGFALVAQLKQGGGCIQAANNCRKGVRRDLKAELKSTKASFVACAGIPNF